MRYKDVRGDEPEDAGKNAEDEYESIYYDDQLSAGGNDDAMTGHCVTPSHWPGMGCLVMLLCLISLLILLSTAFLLLLLLLSQ